MADTRVIMIGGRRCGKSSILASMLHQMATNTELSRKYIQMSESRTSGDTATTSLEEKLNSLQSFITGNIPGRMYLVDFHADDDFNNYVIKVKIPDGKGGVHLGNIKIEFVDCPGECFDQASALRDRLIRYLNTSDTFIIVVDTPYLMDDESDTGKFNQVNKTKQILELFSQSLIFKDADDYKKVIFVPVKCEKWANRIDGVTQKLQRHDYYGPLIQYLKNDPRFSISVIPAFTAGSIEFAEFGEPLITNPSNEPCSPLTANEYRFYNGSIRELEHGESVIKNGKYEELLPFYSWFRNVRREYAPRNCDQLALHIWRFIVYKVKIETDKKIWPNWMYGFPSIKNLQSAIKDMQNGDLLKHTGDGIQDIVLREKV